jgi:diguanylate cyclase (GGDEF)-like protein
MKRFLHISSLREGWPLVVLFTAGAVIATLAFGEVISWLIDYPANWKQYVLRAVIPLLVTPAVVIPLLFMSIRLNTMRAELDMLARTDVLTGLPNRRAFFARANEIFALRQGHEPAALLMIDIDRFKAINDEFGHDAGDAVLKTVAQTILSVVSERGEHRALAARIGGEEFAVVIDGIGAAEAAALAEALCVRVRACAARYQGRPIATTVSVGVAMRQRMQPVDIVLKAADMAVYEAKERGRDRWCVGTPAMPGRNASQSPRARARAA